MESNAMKFESVKDLMDHIMVCIKDYAMYHEFEWADGADRCTSDHGQNMYQIMTWMPDVVAEVMLSISDHNDHYMNKGFTKERVIEFSRILGELCDEYYDQRLNLEKGDNNGN